MVNRDAVRFYDEGEDFWPKRYAIWGRLVALQPGQIGYCIIDSKAIGRFMPPVFPGVQADTLPELARALGLDEQRFMHTLTDYNAACRVGTFDHTVLDDCHTEGLDAAEDALGAADRPAAVLWLRAAARHHLHLPGLEDRRAGARALRRRAERQPVRGRRDDGRQRAGPGLHGRRRHEHRHRIRPHRRHRGGARRAEGGGHAVA